MAITKVTNSVVGSGSATDGYVLTADGSGNSAWEAAAGGASSINDLTDAKTFGTGSIMLGDTTTGTLSNANYNVGVGVDMLNSLTSGYANIAIGFESCKDLTTGHNNVAVGHATLYENIDGEQNVAIGANALQNNTSGNYNTAVGKSALGGCTTGEYNTAVGQIAMDALTTGNFNTALGRNTLGSATTASSTVAVGINSLMNITTGGFNTAVGDSSGQVVTDGTHNCFFGYSSCPQAGDTGTVRTSLFGSNLTSTGSYAYGLGSNMTCDAGYTTLGQGTSDIRAANGTASWATVSDKRVKKDIKDSTAGLAFINDLRPVTFNYKNKGDIPKEFHGYEEGSTEIYKYSTTNHGFIAQEVKEVIDNHTEIADGFKMWDVRETGQQEVAESALIPMLVKAVQELSAEVEELKSRLGN